MIILYHFHHTRGFFSQITIHSFNLKPNFKRFGIDFCTVWRNSTTDFCERNTNSKGKWIYFRQNFVVHSRAKFTIPVLKAKHLRTLFLFLAKVDFAKISGEESFPLWSPRHDCKPSSLQKSQFKQNAWKLHQSLLLPRTLFSFFFFQF